MASRCPPRKRSCPRPGNPRRGLGQQVIPPARVGKIVLLRYDSTNKPYCAATAAQNAVQNPWLTSGVALRKHHALGCNDAGGNNEDPVEVSTIFQCLLNVGYIAGTPGQEFAASDINLHGRTIQTSTPIYVMFDGATGSNDAFRDRITGPNANEFGVISVVLVDNASDEEENHFLALWKRADYWYMSGGEDRGMVFRVAHGNGGHGITNLLFSDEGRHTLCNEVQRVFDNKRCTFNKNNVGTDDECVSPIVFLPKIQLKPPENWDNVDEEEIAYEAPWPVTRTARHAGRKIHSVQIIRDGDARFIEDLTPE